MADEPTARLQWAYRDFLTALFGEGTRLRGAMVTHDPRIMDIADRVAYLDGVLRQE